MTTPSTSPSCRAALEFAEQDFDAAIERLSGILRIPSISTDPESTEDVARAAEWYADAFRDIGMEARVVRTSGHPMVLASREAPEGMPTILYYGHYDVQPADPIELWDSPPFEPRIVDDEHGGRIVARGAVDDKGQVATFLEAIRAWHEAGGGAPVGIKVILEGEEESGSPSLDPFLESHAAELAADVCVVSDTGMWNAETPAITTMLRGMVYSEFEIAGPAMDLHSGMYGGAVCNPLNTLARIVADMHDDDGHVTVPGFYDGVEEPPPGVLADWNGLDFDEEGFLDSAGLEFGDGGENNRSMLERVWSRPTLDVNGMVGGYTGEGAKTIIPRAARVKISCRLVPGQDPEAIEKALEVFIRQRLPRGWSMESTSHGSNPAVVVPNDSPWLDAARRGLAAAYERPAVVIGCGGSIPAVGSIQSILGIDSLLVGFGLDDDRVHSPNEKFDLRCLKGGIRAHIGMLAAFAESER
ncbi:MAG: dipeptidase [Phycisphaerales bacterium]|nr:dipeptidase [Phycisphaerales bacterium]